MSQNSLLMTKQSNAPDESRDGEGREVAAELQGRSVVVSAALSLEQCGFSCSETFRLAASQKVRRQPVE
jgi:hypothetical protein